MRVISSIIVLLLIVLAVFTAVNWSVLVMTTPLSFVVFSVEGPLGVILLCVSLGLVLLVVSYALLLRTSWLVESRRLNRQLQEQRELAQQAETSRFVELKEQIEREFKELRRTCEENSNGISAHLGYLEDKLKGDSGD